MTEATTTPAFEGWAILELMGHRKLGGYVREVTMFGDALCRIDVPEVEGQAAATQFYTAKAIYALTPTTEDLARRVAQGNRPAPVHAFQLEPPRPVRRAARSEDDDVLDADFGDEDEDDSEGMDL